MNTRTVEQIMNVPAVVGGLSTFLIRSYQLDKLFNHLELNDYLKHSINIAHLSTIFLSEIPHNHRRIHELEILSQRISFRKKALPIIAAIIGAGLTAIAHGFLFFESSSKLTVDIYELDNDMLKFILTGSSSAVGAVGMLYEFMHGGLELIGASCDKRPLFYQGNAAKEFFYNLILSLGPIGIFFLFYTESSLLFPRSKKIGIKTLSLVSAMMNLSESHALIGQLQTSFLGLITKVFFASPINLINAIFTGLTLYQAVSHELSRTDFHEISQTIGIASGVILALQKIMILESHHENHSHSLNLTNSHPLEYRGDTFGEDIIYSMLMLGCIYVFEFTHIENATKVLSSGVVAGLFGKLAFTAFNYFFHDDEELHQSYNMDFMINVVGVPLATTLLFDQLAPLFRAKPYKDMLETSSGMLILLLNILLMHWIKKIMVKSYDYAMIRSANFNDSYSKINGSFNNTEVDVVTNNSTTYGATDFTMRNSATGNSSRLNPYTNNSQTFFSATSALSNSVSNDHNARVSGTLPPARVRP